ncbi:hypothetical protein K1719_009331 [Acacia pycnantha]|nr:hypothetical protein K1719_009331 [Acacia pycnantha]
MMRITGKIEKCSEEPLGLPRNNSSLSLGYLKICKEVKETRLKLFKDYFVDERKKLESTKGSRDQRDPPSSNGDAGPTHEPPRRQARGYEIPAESKILVNAWWLANNPAQWKNPKEFRPDRFLEEEAKVDANGNDFRYLPFGVGRRSCPGIILALPILGITLGRLVQNFELLPPPGQSKIDTAKKGGQFSLHILKHSTIVC